MVAFPLMVKEEVAPQSTYMRHDQLHKELINTFLKEFLEAFFPGVHDHMDFHTIKPLSEEVYTNIQKARTRRLDIPAYDDKNETGCCERTFNLRLF